MKTNIHFVLDKSGSMGVVCDSTISGFNEYVQTLKNDKKSKYNFTLTLFDTEVSNKYLNKPLKDVKKLTKKTYEPSGMTALYDAACMTIEKARKKFNKKDKNIVVVMTDGEENSSKEYTQKDFKKLVKTVEKDKNWTFVYLGANQDAWLNAEKFGFSRGCTVNLVQTNAGTQSAFRNVADASMSLSSSSSLSTKEFFSQEQKEAIENSK